MNERIVYEPPTRPELLFETNKRGDVRFDARKRQAFLEELHQAAQPVWQEELARHFMRNKEAYPWPAQGYPRPTLDDVKPYVMTLLHRFKERGLMETQTPIDTHRSRRNDSKHYGLTPLGTLTWSFQLQTSKSQQAGDLQGWLDSMVRNSDAYLSPVRREIIRAALKGEGVDAVRKYILWVTTALCDGNTERVYHDYLFAKWATELTPKAKNAITGSLDEMNYLWEEVENRDLEESAIIADFVMYSHLLAKTRLNPRYKELVENFLSEKVL